MNMKFEVYEILRVYKILENSINKVKLFLKKAFNVDTFLK